MSANPKYDNDLLSNFNLSKYTIMGEKGPIIFTKRELICIILLLRGGTAKEIARQLHLSHRTVESHLLKIRKRIGCFSRTQLIKFIYGSDFFKIVREILKDGSLENMLIMSRIS